MQENKILEEYMTRINNILFESTNTKKFRDRTLQVIRDYFDNASWLDDVFVDPANPNHLSVIDYTEQKFRDEYFHGNVHQTVMRLEPIMMNVALKLGFEQNRPDADKLNRLREIVQYITAQVNNARAAGVKLDFDLSQMTVDNTSFESLNNTFGKIIDDRNQSIEDELNNKIWNKDINPEYEVLFDIDYKTAHKYGNYSCSTSKLCYTQSDTTWNQYTQDGKNTVHLILNKNWKNIPEIHTDNTPYDAYGLSMIFIFISPVGRIVYSNTRWNHDSGDGTYKNDTDHAFTKIDISELLGVNFNEFFNCNVIFDDYDDMGDFINGLARVKKNDEWNFIDKTGKLLLDEWFEFIYDFDDSFARVKKNGKYNFIDKTGKLLLDEWFDYIDIFIDGLARVKKNGKYNVIDKTGKLFLDEWFDNMWNFIDGFAKVKKNGKYNFIDKTGKLLFNEWFDGVDNFKDGFARVWKNGKYNFIDKNGDLLSDEWFDDVDNFEDIIAIVNKNDKYNVIDNTGKLLSDEWFDDVDNFEDGLARVWKNEEWNYIDKTGKLLLDEWFDYIDIFKDGFARVLKNNKYNFIDKTGKMLLDEWFDDVDNFEDGLARIYKIDECNVIDKTGKMLFNEWFDGVSDFKDGLARVLKNNKYNLIDKTGKLLSDEWFDGVYGFEDSFAKVVKNNKYNVIDKNGDLLSDEWFDDVDDADEYLFQYKLHLSESIIDRYVNNLHNILFESTNTKKFRDRTLQVIRDYFNNASWLDNEFVDPANPEHLSVIDYIEKKFRDEYFHGNVHQTVMRLEPIMMNIALKLNFEQNDPDADKLNRLREIVHYISAETDRHRLEKTKPDFDISSMTLENTTYDSLNSTFGSILDRISQEENERLDAKDFADDMNPDYEILADIDYETAHKYGEYSCSTSKLCYTQKKETWDNYTQNGKNTVYLILNKNWKDIPEKHRENTPYDNYGLSMIFVFVNMAGNIAYSNTRWNHQVGDNMEAATKIDHSFTKEDISELLNVNFNKVFVPDTDKFQRMLDNALEMYRDNGSQQGFDNRLNFIDGWSIVCVNGVYNFMNTDGDLRYEEWINLVKESNGYGVINKEGKYNFVNSRGDILYKPDNVDSWFDSANITLEDDKVVLTVGRILRDDVKVFNILNLDGEIRYEPENSHKWFTSMGTFQENFAYVCQFGTRLYNYIDTDGNILYKPDDTENWFTAAKSFAGGFGIVKKGKNGFNYINKKGELLLSDEVASDITYTDRFRDGICLIELDTEDDLSTNYITKDGNLLLPTNVYQGDAFYNKCAEIKVSKSSLPVFINEEGKVVESANDMAYGVEFISDEYSDGWTVVEFNGKMNYADKEKRFISSAWYDKCYGFEDGVGVVRITGPHSTTLYNFLNNKGELVLEEWIEWPLKFKNGYAVIDVLQAYMLIDTAGEEVAAADENVMKINDYREGYAVVTYEGYVDQNESMTLYSLVDEDKHLITPDWFEWCSDFNDGFAMVCAQDGKYNYIKTDGTYLFKRPMYDWFTFVYRFEGNYGMVERRDYFNFLDREGKLIIQYQLADWPTEIYGDLNDGPILIYSKDLGEWNILLQDGRYLLRLGFDKDDIDEYPYRVGNDKDGYYLINNDNTVVPD